jgi:hypothetical protein
MAIGGRQGSGSVFAPQRSDRYQAIWSVQAARNAEDWWQTVGQLLSVNRLRPLNFSNQFTGFRNSRAASVPHEAFPPEPSAGSPKRSPANTMRLTIIDSQTASAASFGLSRSRFGYLRPAFSLRSPQPQSPVRSFRRARLRWWRSKPGDWSGMQCR